MISMQSISSRKRNLWKVKLTCEDVCAYINKILVKIWQTMTNHDVTHTRKTLWGDVISLEKILGQISSRKFASKEVCFLPIQSTQILNWLSYNINISSIHTLPVTNFQQMCGDRLWAFERVVGAYLEGFDDKEERSVQSKTDCEKMCLMETEFVCR